jgi:subtilisin family serine protease
MKRFSSMFLLVAVLAFVVGSVSSADLDFAVKLKTRQFTPSEIKSAPLKSAALAGRHILIQFDHPLTDADKERLAADGIHVLQYVPNYAFTARLERTIDQSAVSAHGIRWFDGIRPEDKISPLITTLGIGDWARRGGDRVQFTVIIHPDEDLTYWASQFEQNYQARIVGFEPSINAIVLIIPEAVYPRLVELDAVLWIEQAMPPPELHNNSSRDNTGAAVLQQPPYNLSGAGVRVAEWDGGLVDMEHQDLSGRVYHGESAPLHWHATHVAGTVLGNGNESNGLYKGMAPSAKLISYLWWGYSSELMSEYSTAISNFGASISTNSWGLGVGDPATQSACEAICGNYFSECATLDNVVRGAAGAPITISWSAGNQRGGSSRYCGSLGWTYNTVTPYATAKNIITVGAINSDFSTMTSFSSWGPCDDGRIKPDVVGPGCQASDDYGVTSCYLGSGYVTACGTSMSAPAIAGTVALMMEHFHNTFPGDSILPSTIKGILINTAEDRGPVGPDFQYGHGKVDGVKAIIKLGIGEPSWLESEISTGEVHLYDLTVSTNEPLKVTLVWDDPGATSLSGPALVNDLDLALIDPFSGEEYPWVLDTLNYAAPATKGIDRINNVETVEIPNPTPGLWKARVTGYNIPDGPQKYSLIFSPDSIYTPGNISALAVFDNGDILDDPGAQVTVQFWVSNVGANPDSVHIQIYDNVSWLYGTVDTSAFLNPYDSVAFSLDGQIPADAMAGDLDSVLCTVTSLIDSSITATGRVLITADAYYNVILAGPGDDTVASPESYQFTVNVDNQGNDSDLVYLYPSNQLGWSISPPVETVPLLAKSNTDVTFTVQVPPEVAHLTANQVTVIASGAGGSGDTVSFTLVVHNPYPPPLLVSPGPIVYTQQRVHTFVWQAEADSFTLYIAADNNFGTIERQYTGLLDTTFTMPPADSLNDGGHYWGVRRYVGVDSSSLQANPFEIIIDNVPPPSMAPIYPDSSEYVNVKFFVFTYGYGGKLLPSESAPEFNRIQLSQDSTFTSGVRTYEPIAGFSFQMPDTVAEGRWYWRVQRADSAGNEAPFSSAATFILDTETPSTPTLLLPADNDTVSDSSVLFRWSTDPPPPYETSPEYFYIQISNSPYFSTTLHAQEVFADSLVLPGSLFTNGEDYYWRVRAKDSAGHSSGYQPDPSQFFYQTFGCGDIDGQGNGTNVADLTFLVDYLFRSGPPPVPLIAGSVNCDADVNVADLTYLVDFLFRGGDPPCCL